MQPGAQCLCPGVQHCFLGVMWLCSECAGWMSCSLSLRGAVWAMTPQR